MSESIVHLFFALKVYMQEINIGAKEMCQIKPVGYEFRLSTHFPSCSSILILGKEH